LSKIKTNHRFIDEAGDTTFYNSKGEFVVGTEGVSKAFGLGMLKIYEPLVEIRNKVVELQNEIVNDRYLNTDPRLIKRINKTGFFFHCSDDSYEIRMKFFELISKIDCSFEMVVARKNENFYNDVKHNFQIESNFYSELLGHLLKNKFQKEDEIILNIAERGRTTSNNTLKDAINKAQQRYEQNLKNKKPIITKIKTNIQNQKSEPLLNIADYMCWAVQRVFEKGEIRYYDYLKEKISLVIDLYDTMRYENWGNYYDNKKNPLTIEQLIK